MNVVELVSVPVQSDDTCTSLALWRLILGGGRGANWRGPLTSKFELAYLPSIHRVDCNQNCTQGFAAHVS